MNVNYSTAEGGQLCAESALLDVKQVAGLLGCSQRHIYRLCDSELMPQPIRLRALVRWNRVELEDWVAQGCPAVSVSNEKRGDRNGM